METDGLKDVVQGFALTDVPVLFPMPGESVSEKAGELFPVIFQYLLVFVYGELFDETLYVIFASFYKAFWKPVTKSRKKVRTSFVPYTMISIGWMLIRPVVPLTNSSLKTSSFVQP